jgi:hypothetical protein
VFGTKPATQIKIKNSFYIVKKKKLPAFLHHICIAAIARTAGLRAEHVIIVTFVIAGQKAIGA